MSLFLLSFIVWIVTLISTIAFALIFWGVNPFQASLSFLIFFFISFFLSLGGILTLVGFYLREFLIPQGKISVLTTALRQAFLISLLVVSILVMYATETFAIWQAALLVVVAVLLELYLR